MSEELEALNELRYGGLVKNDVVCFTKKAFEKRLDIIETALKRLEKIDNSPKVILGRHQGQTKSMIDYVCKNWKEVKITNLEDENKLKALEIIKKKKVNIGDFINACSNICYEQYKFMRNECCFVGIKRISNELTQEEYDLLKEILL